MMVVHGLSLLKYALGNTRLVSQGQAGGGFDLYSDVRDMLRSLAVGQCILRKALHYAKSRPYRCIKKTH